MKMQNMIRAQVMMVGMAAALLVAGSAKAQEITNTEWPDTPVAAQAAPAQAAAPQAAVAAPAAAQVTAAPVTASKPMVTEAASLVPLSPNGRALAISLIVILVGGVMYLRSKADASRMVDAREVHVARSVGIR